MEFWNLGGPFHLVKEIALTKNRSGLGFSNLKCVKLSHNHSNLSLPILLDLYNMKL